MVHQPPPKKFETPDIPLSEKVERVGLSLGRFSHNSWSRRAVGLAFIFILLWLLFFAFWCVFVSHAYSLPQVAKLS
jgi:hypothetical protein